MDLMKDGLITMVFGMGMVYVFLIIMIISMIIMSKCLAPFKDMLVKQAPAPKQKAASKSASAGLSDSDKVLARAAIAAVKLHRGESK